jgi:hypothetical protein
VRRRIIILALMLTIGIFVYPELVVGDNLYGSNAESLVYPPGSMPFGLTYGEWTAKWWQWALSTPSNEFPVEDLTGEKCSINQSGPIWFLAGTPGGSAERSCSIPAGKAVMFPIINVRCDYASDPAAKTESDLRTCAKGDQDLVTHVEAAIDGVPITNLEQYRVQSPLFELQLVDDNPIGLPPGKTEAISDGWWIIMKPLSPGNHEVSFKGVLLDVTTTSTTNFATDVLYHLTVNPS